MQTRVGVPRETYKSIPLNEQEIKLINSVTWKWNENDATRRVKVRSFYCQKCLENKDQQI